MLEQAPESSVRIDKWLWAVRLFKTRSQATAACRNGKILIEGLEIKPSREIKKNNVIVIKEGSIQKTLKVLEILNNRVGAKLVPLYMQDLTPESEYKKLEAIRQQPLFRKRGLGRPTKKERRDLNKWADW